MRAGGIARWLVLLGLACERAPERLGKPCALDDRTACGRGTTCVADAPGTEEPQVSRCIRTYANEAELWADVAANVDQAVLVRSTTLVSASVMSCTSKYCSAPRPNAKPHAQNPGCFPCNTCRSAVRPKNSDFRFVRLASGAELECTGDDCLVSCPPDLDTAHELVGRVEKLGDDRFGLTQVRLKRLAAESASNEHESGEPGQPAAD